MTSPPTGTPSPRTYARVAGFLYLALVPLSIFGVLYVPAALVVPDDAAATAQHLLAATSLVRLSIVSALVVQVVNMLVALLLYKVLRPASGVAAMLMVIFLVVGVPIAMLNEVNTFAALQLASGADSLAAFTTEQRQALVPFFLALHKDGILIAQIFWGLWLLPMGYLVLRSGFLPRLLGVLLMIGCCGYVLDTLTQILLPAYAATISPLATTPAGIAELLFALWLLVRGVNVERWEKRARESA